MRLGLPLSTSGPGMGLLGPGVPYAVTGRERGEHVARALSPARPEGD